MTLTVFAIEKARPGGKPYLLTDGNGLHLLVNPNGSKLWRLRYRYGRRQNMLGLGAFPTVSLANARQRRDDARRLLAEGIDPSQKRKDEVKAVQVTFEMVAAEYIAKLGAEGAAETTISKNRWLLEDLASPLSKRPIAEVTPAEILAILQRIEKSGRRDTARRLRGTIGSVYRYAIATLRATSDPTYPLRGAPLFLPQRARLEHAHVIGTTGGGKSKFLEHCIRQDIANGCGVLVADPHGEHPDSLFRSLLVWLDRTGHAARRTVHLIDPNAPTHTVGFNPLAAPDADTDLSVIAGVTLEAFSRAWGGEDTTSKPTIERVLTAAFTALAELGLTLVEAPLILDRADRHGLRAYWKQVLRAPIFAVPSFK